jgi:hypothetical protein
VGRRPGANRPAARALQIGGRSTLQNTPMIQCRRKLGNPCQANGSDRCAHLCQSPAMPNGRCRMHGGPSPGAPKGNKNALKHGWYTAEAIALRPHISGKNKEARGDSDEGKH